MSNEHYANSPVHPVPAGGCISSGMTLREHYAGLAMQALLSNVVNNGLGFYDVAEEAVRQADKLISALEF